MTVNPPTRYTDVLAAALTGGEDDIRRALERLDESSLSRLRNALRNVADLAEVCAVAAAREFLEASAPEAVWRSTTVIDPYLYWCLDHCPAVAVTRVELKNIHPSVEIQCVQCGRAAR